MTKRKQKYKIQNIFLIILLLLFFFFEIYCLRQIINLKKNTVLLLLFFKIILVLPNFPVRLNFYIILYCYVYKGYGAIIHYS